MRRARRTSAAVIAGALLLGACAGDDTPDVDTDRVEDAAGEAREEAQDAWASFRTGFERLVDEASTGDSAARDELLNQCRDTLEKLRKAEDPRADKVGELCDRIRDADDETKWNEIRQEIDEIDES